MSHSLSLSAQYLVSLNQPQKQSEPQRHCMGECISNQVEACNQNLQGRTCSCTFTHLKVQLTQKVFLYKHRQAIGGLLYASLRYFCEKSSNLLIYFKQNTFQRCKAISLVYFLQYWLIFPGKLLHPPYASNWAPVVVHVEAQ